MVYLMILLFNRFIQFYSFNIDYECYIYCYECLEYRNKWSYVPMVQCSQCSIFPRVICSQIYHVPIYPNVFRVLYSQ